MGMYAYEEAAAEYQRALRALKFAGPDEPGRCELLLRLGAAQARAGNYQQAKESCLQAAEISRRLGAPEQLARAALGFGERQVEGGLVNRQLVALLQEALDALGPQDSALRARLLARLSLEFTFSDETQRTESLSRRRSPWPVGWPTRRRCAPRSMPGGWRCGVQTGWRNAPPWPMRSCGWRRNRRPGDGAGRSRPSGGQLAGVGRRPGGPGRHRGPRPAGRGAPHAIHRWAATTMRALGAAARLLRGSRAAGRRGLVPATGATQRHVHAPGPGGSAAVGAGRLEELRDQLQGLWTGFPGPRSQGRGCRSPTPSSVDNDDAHRGAAVAGRTASQAPRDGIWLPAVALASVLSARLNEPEAAGSCTRSWLPTRGTSSPSPRPSRSSAMGRRRSTWACWRPRRPRWAAAADHFEAAIRSP